MRNIQIFMREIKPAKAFTDFAVAVCLIRVLEDESNAYNMAIFHLKRQPDLTSKMAIESLKAVEQSLNDESKEANIK